jgi:N-acetylmuramic acid 6-phosphate (MurNAc-6-P) etherase
MDLIKIASSKEHRNSIEAHLIQLKNECNLLPITEQSNLLTINVDAVDSGNEILNLLAKTDREIFDGWRLNEKNLKTDGLKTDFYILNKLECLSSLLVYYLDNKIKGTSSERFKLIFSGCGTSGRLAYLSSQSFNEYFRKRYDYSAEDLCDYIIAGDEYALVNSVESVEDKPKVGAEKLISKLDSNTKCIFIGITCGLSAPFVAGQIDYCLDEMENREKGESKIVACCVIGFNPVEMSRKTNVINEKNETFLELMLRMRSLETNEPNKYFILNPLIGPEPITGSSRMKSGTATKIMLDVIINKALLLLDNRQDTVLDLIEYYDSLLKVIYSEESIKNLGKIIDQAGISLKNLNKLGSINYLTDSERLGLLCCVDASECLPTYGAAKRDIKGFISVNTNGESLTSIQNGGRSDWNLFIKECSTTWSQIVLEKMKAEFLSEYCLFILIDNDNDDKPVKDIVEEFPTKGFIEKTLSKQSKCQIVHLDINFRDIFDQAKSQINPYFAQCLQEFALKLSINAISTGAHVLIGKTYENIMIDVKVSNEKLYWRAIGILQKFSKNKTLKECEKYLLCSIYANTNNDDEATDIPEISKHIEKATEQSLVVPKALIMLLTGCDYEFALKFLQESNNSVKSSIKRVKESY